MQKIQRSMILKNQNLLFYKTTTWGQDHFQKWAPNII